RLQGDRRATRTVRSGAHPDRRLQRVRTPPQSRQSRGGRPGLRGARGSPDGAHALRHVRSESRALPGAARSVATRGAPTRTRGTHRAPEPGSDHPLVTRRQRASASAVPCQDRHSSTARPCSQHAVSDHQRSEEVRMRRVVVIVVAVIMVVASGSAAQEVYPTRPVTIVNPFPPGGIADLTARPLAAALERLLKQPFVVSNKPGAAGAVGAQSVAVAKPDGYTLLVALVSISSTPEVDKLFGRPAIDTRDQFVGIARLNADPPLLVVNEEYARKHGWTTLKELVDDARKRPGEITYASSGPYGASHLPIEML